MLPLKIAEPKSYPEIKKLIWLYFWLLIFEGALRKWVVPFAANYLLLIRVPVVLAVYYYAIRGKVFKFSLTLFLGTCLAVLTLVAGGIVLGSSPAVVLYGFQANFLQLPMIYVISRVFNIEDVKRMGYWTLVLAIPLALICGIQFMSSSHSFWNAGATVGGGQIGSSGGHVRASATFSFVSGAIYFFALVLAYVVYGYLVARTYPLWLMLGVAASLIIASICCASRSLLGLLGIILVGVLFSGIFLNRKYLAKTVLVFITFGVLGVIASQISFVQQSAQVFGQRLRNADRSDEGISGTANERVLAQLTRPFVLIYNHEQPILGYGLGIGTIGGAKLQTGSASFLYGRDVEREWPRHIVESGEILGTCMILLRLSIAFQVFLPSMRSAVRGNILPFLLMSDCVWPLMTDKLGQASALGFIVLVSGLSLAANRIPPQNVAAPVQPSLEPEAK